MIFITSRSPSYYRVTVQFSQDHFCAHTQGPHYVYHHQTALTQSLEGISQIVLVIITRRSMNGIYGMLWGVIVARSALIASPTTLLQQLFSCCFFFIIRQYLSLLQDTTFYYTTSQSFTIIINYYYLSSHFFSLLIITPLQQRRRSATKKIAKITIRNETFVRRH